MMTVTYEVADRARQGASTPDSRITARSRLMEFVLGCRREA